jgi:hypothetical protein
MAISRRIKKITIKRPPIKRTIIPDLEIFKKKVNNFTNDHFDFHDTKIKKLYELLPIEGKFFDKYRLLNELNKNLDEIEKFVYIYKKNFSKDVVSFFEKRIDDMSDQIDSIHVKINHSIEKIKQRRENEYQKEKQRREERERERKHKIMLERVKRDFSLKIKKSR